MPENTIIVLSNDPDAPAIQHWQGNMAELDALEELLYIWWELTPVLRNWKRELIAKSWTAFDYHGCEPCIVHRVRERCFRVVFRTVDNSL